MARALPTGVVLMTPLAPPTAFQLAKTLRTLHIAFSHPDGGGEFIGLVDAGPDIGWILEIAPHPDMIGREYVPGDGKKFDALGAARRLLAAALDALEARRP